MKASRNYTSLLSGAHVYTYTFARYLFIGIIGLVIVILVPAMILSKNKNAPLLGIAIIGTLVAFCLLVIFFVGKVRLITGREGIIFVGWGYTVFTPWNNIVKAKNMSRGGTMLQMRNLPEQMDLEQGIREQRAAVEIRSKLYRPQTSYSPYDTYHLISLLRPGLPPRTSKLGQDLLRYAPQVYGEDAESTPQIPSSKSA